MAQLLENQRETWGTRSGFVLAAVGSAVGLGNLWSFPYKIYSCGGGAFLVPYIIAIFLVGIPLLSLEFSLGHFTQKAAPNAYQTCNKKLEFIGWWAIILGFIIITYYPVILGYCLSFFWISLKGIVTGGALPWAGQGVDGVANAHNFFFKDYLNMHDTFAFGQFQWQLFWPLLIAWVLMYLCIFKGVKAVDKIVWLTVPIPWLMLVILTVRGLTLEGSTQGLAYYLTPDWSRLLEPKIWCIAFGQAFFSMSLAFGVMITYASFLHRKSDINNNATIIGISDFATSFIAGIAVFAILGAMAFATTASGHPVGIENVTKSGPSLAFVAFPYALSQLPYSAWFSAVFFFALITLGIDSAFSITESVLASIVDKTGWRRSVVLVVMSVVGLCSGLVYVTQGGLNWLGLIDGMINGAWGIALLGLLECLALGWIFQLEKLRLHANSRSDFQFGRWWNILIRTVIPVLLGTLFFWKLYDDLVMKGFVIFDEKGNLIFENLVGYCVAVFAPLLLSVIIASTTRNAQTNSQAYSSDKSDNKAGVWSLVLIALSIAILLKKFYGIDAIHNTTYLAVAAVLGGFALIFANVAHYRADKNLVRASISSSIAGIGSVFLVSFLITSYLVKMSDSAKETNVPAVTDMTGVSYVILAFVSFVIIGGLGWCFYKAVSSVKSDETIQLSNEV